MNNETFDQSNSSGNPSTGSGQALSGLIEKTFREEHGRVLAALISQLGDFELAEDALINALEGWEIDDVPRNPGARLLTVAKRRAIDRLRRALIFSSSWMR